MQMNRPTAYNYDTSRRCSCLESDDDGDDRVRLKNIRRKIAGSYVSNVIICTILLAYTFVGAVMFLAIEGDMSFYSFASLKVVPSSSNFSVRANSNTTVNKWLSRISEESRARVVQNIWDITVNLNILYRENWTRLAAEEIARFQQQVVKGLAEEMSTKSQSVVTNELRSQDRSVRMEKTHKTEWNLAKAFFYSLTVLTTIGFGNCPPRTTLGKSVTMGYAAIGIPLMLLYLSSVGSLLSNCVKGVFTPSLCCCLCSKCGYCCYDEKRMQEKERRTRQKRAQNEIEQQTLRESQEPFYGTSSSSAVTKSYSPVGVKSVSIKVAATRTSTNVMDSKSFVAGSSIVHSCPSRGNCLAPISFCFAVKVIYICGGALILCHLETSWTYLDGIFFCFMTLSTIGFGEPVPPSSVLSTKINLIRTEQNLIFWFSSLYILVGMALTAMCFNILYYEVVHRLKHNDNESSGRSRIIKESSVLTKIGSSSNCLDNDNVVNDPNADSTAS